MYIEMFSQNGISVKAQYGKIGFNEVSGIGLSANIETKLLPIISPNTFFKLGFGFVKGSNHEDIEADNLIPIQNSQQIYLISNILIQQSIKSKSATQSYFVLCANRLFKLTEGIDLYAGFGGYYANFVIENMEKINIKYFVGKSINPIEKNSYALFQLYNFYTLNYYGNLNLNFDITTNIKLNINQEYFHFLSLNQSTFVSGIGVTFMFK